jgi:transporter family-2 protein
MGQPGRKAGWLARLGGPGALPLASAALAGGLMAVQGTFNSVLSKAIGLLETSLLVQALGMLTAAVLLWVFRLGSGNWGAISQAPRYTLLGGTIGVAIVYLVAFGISRAGVANATTAIIIGQVSTALLIDSLGWFGVEPVPWRWTRLLGVALLALAGYLMLRR